MERDDLTIDAAARVLAARFRLAVAADPGALARTGWYQREARAIRAMAHAAGADPERALAAAAVLSPAVRWEDVMTRLPAFLRGPAPMPGYGRNVRRAREVLAGRARPSGPKVERFARNLAGDPSVVTVDRWAARAAGLPETGGRRWYRTLESAYQRAAVLVGLAPARFQAILWESVRNRRIPSRTGARSDDRVG